MPNRTKDYSTIFGYSPCNQTNTVASDLYGGGSTPSLGVGNKFYFDELKISDVPEFVEDGSRNGTQLAVGSDIQSVSATFEGKTKVFTHGMNTLLTSALGWYDLEGSKTSGGSNYAHFIYFNTQGKDQRTFTTAEQAKITGYAAGDIYNTHGKYLISEGPSDVILTNGQITEFEISGSVKDPISLSFNGVGETVTRDTGKTQSAALTAPAGAFTNFYAMRHCTASTINSVSYNITDWSIKGKFGVIDSQQSSTTGTKKHYPYSDGLSELSFEATIFLHDQDVLKGLEQAQTLVPIKLEFTRSTNLIRFLMPSVKLTSVVAEYGNGGSVKVTGKLYNLETAETVFAAERTFTTAFGYDFPSPLAIVYVDNSNTHGLRAV